jgi:hypothetical protein
LYSAIESELQLAASSDGNNRFAKQFGGYSNRTDSEMHGGDPAAACVGRGRDLFGGLQQEARGNRKPPSASSCI